MRSFDEPFDTSSALVPVVATPLPAAYGDLAGVVGPWLLTLKSAHSRTAYATDFGYRYSHADGAYQLQRRPGDHAWLDFLGRLAVQPLSAQEVHVNMWRDHLAEVPFKPATVARKLVSVSSFYGYLVRRRALAENPAGFAGRPEVDKVHSTTFSPTADDLVRVLTAAEAAGPRTQALIEVLTFTGARVSEVTGADLGDLREDHGMTLLRVTRKNGVIQDLPVAEPALGTLRTYLGPRTTGPLFLDESGSRRMDRRRALEVIQAVGVRSGVTDRLTPHSLRHAYAAACEAAGVPVTRIQQDLGHRDIRTTQRYLHASSRHQDFGGFRMAEMLAKKARRKNAA